MYKLLAMDQCGRLYELSSRGWVRSGGTSFPSLPDARKIPEAMMVPPLPGGQYIADSYVGRVDSTGAIVKTFPFIPVEV